MPDNAQPLLILTRPAAAAARFCATEAAMLSGVTVLAAPVLDIVAVDAALPAAPATYRGAIFTSENGAAQAARLGLPTDITAWCVGGQTARAAEAAGFTTRTAGGDAESLLALLETENVTGPLVHIRGAHARGDVAARLTARGVPCDLVVAYDQIALPLPAAVLAAFAGDAPVVVPLFSPRSAALLRAQMPTLRAPLHIAAISAAAAAAFTDLPQASCHIATAPLGPEMAEATARAIAAAKP